MVQVKDWLSPILTEAVLAWSGWQSAAAPRRDASALRQRFGDKIAADLLPVIKSIEDEFYSSQARYEARNLREMEEIASSDFRAKHPDAPEDIVRAFAWCYAFDYK